MMTVDPRIKDRPMSFSQLSTFLQCRYRWFLQYPLGIRPKVRGSALEIGDGVHRALAELLAGNEPGDGLDQWFRDLLNSMPIQDDELEAKARELRATALAVTNRAIAGLEELGYWTYQHPKTKAPMVEAELVVPVAGWPTGMLVKLDWMAYDPINRDLWVVDFKTRGYFTDEQDEWANLQNAMYHAAALHYGIPAVGTLTFQISSTPPKKPKLNKDGTMSRADVACDWLSYVDALNEAGLDPTDYADMRGKLETKECVRKTPIIRTAQQLERIWNDVVEPLVSTIGATYDYWLRYGGKTTEQAMLPRNLSPRSCNYCGQRKVCHGDLRGYDVPGILQLEYDARPQALAHFLS